MNTDDIRKFPDGRIFIKEGYQPKALDTIKLYSAPSIPLNPPSFESGVISPATEPAARPATPDEA